MVKLILSDIDGTIMPKGHEHVSERVLEVFHEALDAGIHVGPCSGRGPDWVASIFLDDAACYATAVQTNGLHVVLDGEVIRDARMNKDALGQVAGIVSDVDGAGLVCFDGKVPYLVAGSKEDLTTSFPRYGQTCVPVAEIPDSATGKANVFQARGMEATRELVGRLNHEVLALDFDVAMPTFSNVMPAGVNKATGIDLLCKRIGCTLDEVVVFGDAGNDLSMLNHVPNSVAVANATDDAIAAARWHIGACADNAVADAIEALASGEWPFVL